MMNDYCYYYDNLLLYDYCLYDYWYMIIVIVIIIIIILYYCLVCTCAE